jgi:hypothetical protein
VHLINPINAETIAPYIGKPVCVVLRDETCYHGYLGGIQNGQLFLNGDASVAGTLSTSATKAESQLSKMAQKAKTSAFGYGGYGGYGYGGYGWDLAAISLLFLLPFLFI